MHWINSIALRYFFSHKKDQFTNLTSKIAIFATSFAICMLIIAFSVIRGFEETVMAKVLHDQGHIIIYGNGSYNPDSVISNLPKNLRYIQMIETNCMVIDGARNETAILRGVPKSELSQFSQKKFSTKGLPKIIVGYKFAQNLNLKIGDNIFLILPIKANPPFGLTLESIEFQITDIAKFNLHDLNRYGIVMELSQAQKILNMPKKVNKMICFDENPKKAIETARKLQEILPNYYVYTWKNLNMTFADIMRVQRNMVTIILLAIIFLASIACCVSLILFIYTKKREIMILKILGATNKNIMSIFLRIGLIIATMSAFFGTVAGLLLCYFLDDLRKIAEYIFKVKLFDTEVYLLPALPVSVNFADVTLILLANFFIMFFAVLIPALKSAKMKLHEAL